MRSASASKSAEQAGRSVLIALAAVTCAAAIAGLRGPRVSRAARRPGRARTPERSGTRTVCAPRGYRISPIRTPRA